MFNRNLTIDFIYDEILRRKNRQNQFYDLLISCGLIFNVSNLIVT